MATDLVSFSFDSLPIRTFADDAGEPWFCAKDVCDVLEYTNNRKAISDHCRAKGVTNRDTLTEGGVQSLSFINEGNLYRLIIKSRKPEAERFEAWVCDDVLPAIRKTGHYVHPAFRPDKTRQALPGGLTIEQQDAVKALVKSRVEILPHDQQAKAAITCWSSIKSKFGVTYKEVPAAHFAEVLSLVARLPLDQRAAPKALPLDLNYPLESAAPPVGCEGLAYYAFAQAKGWIDPGWELLMKLKAAGFNVDGPIYSHQAKIHVMTAMYNGLLGKAVESMNVACATLPYAPIYLR